MVNKETGNVIRVAYACNDAFVLAVCTSIKSAMENITDNNLLEVFILYNEENLSSKNRNSIANVLNNSKLTIKFIPVKNDIYKNYISQKNSHWSVEIFYRLVLPKLLPYIDKIIYLDCDTTVLGDLSELYNINIEDFYAAGVNDTSETIKECCKRLNVEKYFNSGVLLLKMDKGKLLTTSVSCEIPYEILSKNDFYQVGRVIDADVASPKPEKDQLIKQLKKC